MVEQLHEMGGNPANQSLVLLDLHAEKRAAVEPVPLLRVGYFQVQGEHATIHQLEKISVTLP